mgnify:CR=1 FL=1
MTLQELKRLNEFQEKYGRTLTIADVEHMRDVSKHSGRFAEYHELDVFVVLLKMEKRESILIFGCALLVAIIATAYCFF